MEVLRWIQGATNRARLFSSMGDGAKQLDRRWRGHMRVHTPILTLTIKYCPRTDDTMIGSSRTRISITRGEPPRTCLMHLADALEYIRASEHWRWWAIHSPHRTRRICAFLTIPTRCLRPALVRPRAAESVWCLREPTRRARGYPPG